MEQVVLINGKKQSKISVFNRTTMFGDGLFETCLVENNKLRFWSKHFMRLEKGRSVLKINEVKESLWLKDINKAISSLKTEDCIVKVILSRGESTRGYSFSDDISPTRIVIATSIPEGMPDQYSLTICQSGYSTNAILSGIKHCNRLEQVLSRIGMTGDECIMLDESGFVVSASQANVFTIKESVLSTPNLEECGIEGTRRDVVLGLASELGLQIEVGAITVPELLDADEVFITNSIIGIRPVYMINDKIFSSHETTEKLNELFHEVQNKSRIISKPSKGKSKYTKWLILSALLFFILWFYNANNVEVASQVIYQIPHGSTINLVADELESLDYINSSWYFISLAKILNIENSLKSGYYEINAGMRLNELLDIFSKGDVATRKITLVEGLTVQEYYTQMINNEAITIDADFDATMKSIGLKKPYEGKFWPDTYIVNYGDTASSVFARAKTILNSRLEDVWQGRDKKLILKSIDELLILASLIEKETAAHAEKSQIAGVFVRRLEKGMRLQTDASVVYALGENYKGRLTKKDLDVDSPYNTYKNKGLPPSAIGSVGVESLYAASHPDKGKSLYFVSKKDGTHAFSNTYKEHQQNINKYLKNL